MEKALEILLMDRSDIANHKIVTTEMFNEAIAELQEAMKPKTCDGCKQSWKPNNQTFHKYFCEYLKISIHGNFCCNRYEAKEQL